MYTTTCRVCSPGILCWEIYVVIYQLNNLVQKHKTIRDYFFKHTFNENFFYNYVVSPWFKRATFVTFPCFKRTKRRTWPYLERVWSLTNYRNAVLPKYVWQSCDGWASCADQHKGATKDLLIIFLIGLLWFRSLLKAFRSWNRPVMIAGIPLPSLIRSYNTFIYVSSESLLNLINGFVLRFSQLLTKFDAM